MLLGEGTTTATTGGSGQGALDREDEFVGLGEVSLKHAHIGNIERDRDEGLLGHGAILRRFKL